ncbi:putative motility protein [Pseudothauera nasutitermitis]|uniref:Putative motility protein n=1 Tax=Pseudothauera nasutitermitis TaxID=2565930 RepID=A0A4S4B1R9_9RHOO|nr:YjfB family protein [Pseudothauera nasutitermitis]THF66443.1 putative motility protein [Pseudothauera nasutitermitis]
MDVSSIASLSTDLAQARVGDAVGLTVLKKALDIQEQHALQLIAALPQVPSNPPHLGQNIDVRA